VRLLFDLHFIASALCRGIDLLFLFRRSFPKIVSIVIRTATYSRIILCNKPFAATAAFASIQRSQPAINGDHNNSFDCLGLRLSFPAAISSSIGWLQSPQAVLITASVPNAATTPSASQMQIPQ
jgi:hypothetical protein